MQGSEKKQMLIDFAVQDGVQHASCVILFKITIMKLYISMKNQEN